MNAKTNESSTKTLEQLRKEQSKTHWARLIAENLKAAKSANPAKR